MGHTSTDVTQYQFPEYGEVEAAVAVRAHEKGEGRDERKKQRAWEEKRRAVTAMVTLAFDVQ